MTQDIPDECRFCCLHYNSENFCAKLSLNDLVELKAASKTTSLKHGRELRGEVPRRWPVIAITKGVLSLQHILHDGRLTIAALFMRGEILDVRNSADRKRGKLIALGEVELCGLSADVFEYVIVSNPAARTVAWGNIRSQAFRAMDHASDLAKKHAMEKLASFIFECRNRQSLRIQKDKVEMPLRRSDLAAYLGMQPETVSRIFKNLEKNEIVKVTDLSIIQILNAPALRRIANGDRMGHKYNLLHQANVKKGKAART